MVLGAAAVVAAYAAAASATEGSVEHLLARSGSDWPLVALAAAGVTLQVLVTRLDLPLRRTLLATGLGAAGSGFALAAALDAGGHSLGAVAAATGLPGWTTTIPTGAIASAAAVVLVVAAGVLAGRGWRTRELPDHTAT